MAVAIYHYEYGNVKGARLMLQTAKNYLTKYRPTYWSLNVDDVLSYIDQLLKFLPKHDQITLEMVKANPVPKFYMELAD